LQGLSPTVVAPKSVFDLSKYQDIRFKHAFYHLIPLYHHIIPKYTTEKIDKSQQCISHGELIPPRSPIPTKLRRMTQIFQGFENSLLVLVRRGSPALDKENILPSALQARSRVDTRKVQPVSLENEQRVGQSTR
jgi:hypothetical protein